MKSERSEKKLDRELSTKSGMCHFQAKFSKMLDSSHKFQGGMLQLDDSTEQKLAELELRRSNSELENFAYMTLLQKADDGDVRRNIWGWWRSHHPHIFRREHLHGSFFSGVIIFSLEMKDGLSHASS